MLDIGQNNLVGGFYSKALDQILASISIIFSKFEDGLKELYDLGARNFWVHNTGSLGCLGQNIIKFETDASKLDKLGFVSTTIWMWFRKIRLAQVGAFQDFNCQCISNLFTLSTLKKAVSIHVLFTLRLHVIICYMIDAFSIFASSPCLWLSVCVHFYEILYF